MKKWMVSFYVNTSLSAYIEVEVEAEDEKSAIEEASGSNDLDDWEDVELDTVIEIKEDN